MNITFNFYFRTFLSAVCATALLSITGWVLLDDRSWIAIGGSPFMHFFWQAPLSVVVGFVGITYCCSTFFLAGLTRGRVSRKNFVAWFLLFTLLYSISINLARDLGFCLGKWMGVVEMGKSYCRPEAYLSMEHWANAILLSAIYYSAILSCALMLVNYGIYLMQGKHGKAGNGKMGSV